MQALSVQDAQHLLTQKACLERKIIDQDFEEATIKDLSNVCDRAPETSKANVVANLSQMNWAAGIWMAAAFKTLRKISHL